MGLRDPLRKTVHAIPPGVMRPTPLDASSAPDEWIDHYSRGSLPQVVSSRSSWSSVSVNLEFYHEKTLDWFVWIDIFQAFVHDTLKSPLEKLSVPYFEFFVAWATAPGNVRTRKYRRRADGMYFHLSVWLGLNLLLSLEKC